MRTLAVVLIVALVGGVVAFVLSRPRAHVLVGVSFASARDENIELRAGQPIRALLTLPGKLGTAGFVDMELRHVDSGRVLQVIPVRALGRDDEIEFAMPDVVQLVGKARGQFGLSFSKAGQALGEGRFRVRP